LCDLDLLVDLLFGTAQWRCTNAEQTTLLLNPGLNLFMLATSGHSCSSAYACCAAALKLGGLRLSNMLKREPKQQQAQADAPSAALDAPQPEQQQSSSEVVARLKATAAGCVREDT
jgi:hypothetical protein